MHTSSEWDPKSNEYRNNPDVGPRGGECRLGLGVHNTSDPYCDHHTTNEQENK